MNPAKMIVYTLSLLLLQACSPVKNVATNQYQLTTYSAKKIASHPHSITLSVTTPEATSGYQTNAMQYVKKPFQVEPFAKNTWVSPPADMLFPLLTQSLQASGYFAAVVSSPYNQGAEYRLDTQLLTLKQNFLKRPSVLEFSAKVALIHVEDNRVLSSQVIGIEIPCSMDTPYGGVLAANQATRLFTEQVVHFVIKNSRHQ